MILPTENNASTPLREVTTTQRYTEHCFAPKEAHARGVALRSIAKQPPSHRDTGGGHARPTCGAAFILTNAQLDA
jgi:hypothetical protein